MAYEASWEVHPVWLRLVSGYSWEVRGTELVIPDSSSYGGRVFTLPWALCTTDFELLLFSVALEDVPLLLASGSIPAGFTSDFPRSSSPILQESFFRDVVAVVYGLRLELGI